MPSADTRLMTIKLEGYRLARIGLMLFCPVFNGIKSLIPENIYILLIIQLVTMKHG